MKKTTFILLAVAVMAALMSGTALANFGPHGGYGTDTDACAGCHRAHTSFSSVSWKTNPTDDATHSALLVSNSTKMSEFCYACHGNAAPGASTNVQAGIFDSGPSGTPTRTATNGTVVVAYQTNSSFNATLNGGGFDTLQGTTATSQHGMDLGDAGTDPMWGAGTSLPTGKNLTCTDCHDPHGSSNYRLLKDLVNNVAVGGYDANDNPQPFVVSAEEGYPSGGWLKHQAGADQMATYKPDYTTAEYRTTGAASGKSMSQWCAACHTQYAKKSSAYNYGNTIANGSAVAANTTYHRHPIDTSLVGGMPGNANRVLPTDVLLDPNLPLEHAGSSTRTDAATYTDYMGCLTCHRAHGTTSQMSGWAVATIDSAGRPVRQSNVASHGVEPNSTSALLRADNRGVCERCHNK